MPLTTTWSFKFGTVSSTTDLTSRVLKIDINQRAPIGQFGVGSATITLQNNDGAFTPRGGGTYSTTDWFTKAVFIDATIPTNLATSGLFATGTAGVFHGFITNFTLEDNGLNSTVTFNCQDAMSCVAKNFVSSFVTASAATEFIVNTALNLINGSANAWNAATPTPKVVFPDLGLGDTPNHCFLNDMSYANTSGIYTGQERSTYSNNITFSSCSSMDILNTAIMPMSMFTMWGGTMRLDPTFGYAGYQVNYLPGLKRTYSVFTGPGGSVVGNTAVFKFNDVKSINSSSFPFSDLSIEYNVPDTINQSTIGRATSGTTPQTFTNTTQQIAYGNRSISNSNVATISDATALSLATEYATRYAVSRFSPNQITFSSKQILNYATDNAANQQLLFSLYTITHGLWQRTEVTWTGKGIPAQTYATKIRGRQISITPTDAVFTLELVPAVDNSTFIVGSDTIVNSSNEEQLGVRTIQ